MDKDSMDDEATAGREILAQHILYGVVSIAVRPIQEDVTDRPGIAMPGIYVMTERGTYEIALFANSKQALDIISLHEAR
jgi:hypothetical protein